MIPRTITFVGGGGAEDRSIPENEQDAASLWISTVSCPELYQRREQDIVFINEPQTGSVLTQWVWSLLVRVLKGARHLVLWGLVVIWSSMLRRLGVGLSVHATPINSTTRNEIISDLPRKSDCCVDEGFSTSSPQFTGSSGTKRKRATRQFNPGVIDVDFPTSKQRDKADLRFYALTAPLRNIASDLQASAIEEDCYNFMQSLHVRSSSGSSSSENSDIGWSIEHLYL